MRKKDSWFRPYIINPHNIERVVEQGVPGVYVLGHIGQDKKFKVKHIKSSGDVKSELKKHLGQYQVFMYKPFRNLWNQTKQGQQQLGLKMA